MTKKFFLLFALIIPFYSFAADDDVQETQLQDNQEEELIAAVDNLGPTASGFVSEGDFGPEDDQFVDPHVLRDFIESKGLIECRKKTGKLTLASDVRARWVAAGEEVDGVRVRGQGTDTAINRYKSEVNLFLDYVAPKTWVSTKLKWVNFDGKDGGSATRVELDRGFIGYDIYHEDDTDFYIEVGRSKLDFMFESRVEFTSTFDGIHLFYTQCWPTVGKLTIHGGPFIVDSFTHHYAWVGEIGVTGWKGTGLGMKYSLIDWVRRAPTQYYGNLKDSELPPSITSQTNNLIYNNPRYNFLVSQMLFGYDQKIDFLRCKTLYLYGAVLMNHDAKRREQTCWRKLNGAWYAGFTLGKLCKACDWSIDINYQSVQAQAVPEFDSSGIGHGNAANTLLSDAILLGLPAGEARGFTNFRGWELSALYAMTDNLSLRSVARFSRPRNKCVGDSFKYKTFEMSVIYAF